MSGLKYCISFESSALPPLPKSCFLFHRVLQDLVTLGVLQSLGREPQEELLGAPGCSLLPYLSRGTEMETHRHCLLPVKSSFLFAKPHLPCATNLYSQILISSNGLFQGTHYFALGHLFSFRRESLRCYVC